MLTNAGPLKFSTVCEKCLSHTTISLCLDGYSPATGQPHTANSSSTMTSKSPAKYARYDLNATKAERFSVKEKGASWDPQRVSRRLLVTLSRDLLKYLPSQKNIT